MTRPRPPKPRARLRCRRRGTGPAGRDGRRVVRLARRRAGTLRRGSPLRRERRIDVRRVRDVGEPRPDFRRPIRGDRTALRRQRRWCDWHGRRCVRSGDRDVLRPRGRHHRRHRRRDLAGNDRGRGHRTPRNRRGGGRGALDLRMARRPRVLPVVRPRGRHRRRLGLDAVGWQVDGHRRRAARLLERRPRRRSGRAGGVGGDDATGVQVALQPLQIGLDVTRRLIPALAILLEQPADDVLERRDDVGVDRARRHRDAIQDLVEDDRRRLALEGLDAGRHLVHHHAEREEVAALVDGLAAGVLGRHVGDGADGHPGRCQGMLLGDRDVDRGQAAAVRHHLRETEVHHLHLAALGDEDVAGLDVAVEDALAVRGVERVRDVDRDVDDPIDRQRAGAEDLVQGGAVDQLHHDEAAAVMLADVVERADVGVVQRRGGARLALEALRGQRVGGGRLGQELHCDVAAEPEVLPPVDDTHAASAQPIDNAVVRDYGTDHLEPNRAMPGKASRMAS